MYFLINTLNNMSSNGFNKSNNFKVVISITGILT